MELRRVILPLTGFFALAFPAGAAELVVDRDGQLVGATGVEVEGKSYNVEFLDSSCSDIFDGCDNPSDFIFENRDQAIEAVNVLLEQVLVDGPSGSFDSDPSLTFGCSDDSVCFIVVPDASQPGDERSHRAVQNFAGDDPGDRAGGITLERTYSLADFDRAVYARFSQSGAVVAVNRSDCAEGAPAIASGQWRAEAEPGAFVSSGSTGSMIVPMFRDANDVEFTSFCDGRLQMSYRDRQLGLIVWDLRKLGSSETVPKSVTAIPNWNEFSQLARDLNAMSANSTIYVGTSTIKLPQIGGAPSQMVLAYRGEGAEPDKQGTASIAMRIGPVQMRGMGEKTFWARSGPVHFKHKGS